MKNYLAVSGGANSQALWQAFRIIEGCYRDAYKLDKAPDAYNSDVCKRIQVAADFVRKAIELIDEEPKAPAALVVRKGTYPRNIYDHISKLFVDMCIHVSSITAPPETCWMIHHNIVWDAVFSGAEHPNDAWATIQFKVRRLLYDHVADLSRSPGNFQGGRVLGYCLQILGLSRNPVRKGFGHERYALAVVVQAWARRNYLWLREEEPEVADAVLIGGLSFDEPGRRLVKTYLGRARDAARTYLDLEPIRLVEPAPTIPRRRKQFANGVDRNSELARLRVCQCIEQFILDHASEIGIPALVEAAKQELLLLDEDIRLAESGGMQGEVENASDAPGKAT